MIDNGDVSDNVDFQCYTPFYFNNPHRLDKNSNQIKINNEDERYKNEIY